MLAQVQGRVKVPSAQELGFPWTLSKARVDFLGWAWSRQVVDTQMPRQPVSTLCHVSQGDHITTA